MKFSRFSSIHSPTDKIHKKKAVVAVVASGVYSTGLVLHMDAGNASSYPGSGTTWTSLVGSYSGTMNAGVTYSSASGGSMVFNGASGYVNVPSASAITGLTNNVSIEAWYKSNNNYPKILATGSGSFGLNFGQYTYTSNTTKWKVTKYGVVDIYIGSIPQDTNWHQVVVTYSSTGGTTVYVDGALSGTLAGNNNLAAGTSNIPIGQSEGGYHNGSIGIVRWYNTALTSAQVLQNFNANRARFGI